jgi:hypothetical protein
LALPVHLPDSMPSSGLDIDELLGWLAGEALEKIA